LLTNIASPQSKLHVLIPFLALLALLTASAVAMAQDAKPIFDGRLELKATKLSDAEEALMKDNILPAARKAWHKAERDQDCMTDFKSEALDAAPGSFTKPKAEQKAILYKFCVIGQDQALNGIAILENGALVAHIVYEGDEDYAIGALPDINGNGLSEILLATGGTNQGITWQTISILEIHGTEITKFGHTETSSDDCGINEKSGKTKAQKILVKAGPTPAFFHETYISPGCAGGNTWRKSGVMAPLTLEEDSITYDFIK